MAHKDVDFIQIPVDQLYANDWNPNVQDDKTFNALVKNIEEIGMVEPVMVVPEPSADGEKQYRIISGHHRWEACRILDYTEIPAVIMDGHDEDWQKFQTVRMNVLKGKLDPVKFTKLFDEMAERYGEEATKEAMAFMDEKAFASVYVNVRDQLPKEMADKLDQAKDDIKTVDDLSRILNEMFSKYGDTLSADFMVFTYGGKAHYWIQMDSDVKKKVDKIADIAMSMGISINTLFSKLLTSDIADDIINDMVANGEVADPDEAMNF